MRKAFEFSVFGALALGLHVALMADYPEQGADAGGAGGDALLTLVGATPQIETMVETWTRPPSAQPVVDTVQTLPEIERPLLPMSSVRLDEAPNSRLRLAAMIEPRPETPERPEIDTTPPPQPKVEPDPPKVTADRRPKKRPEREPAKKPEQKPKSKAKPAERAQRASAGSTAQKAAGSGGSAQAGNSGKAATKTLSPGKEASLIATWGARIRSQVERRKRHPGGRAKGRVVLKISVVRNGQLQSVSVRRSSGQPALDAAAVAAVKRAGRFPAAPKQLTKPVFVFSLPINFGR